MFVWNRGERSHHGHEVQKQHDIEKCGRTHIDVADELQIWPHCRTEEPEGGSRCHQEPETASAAARPYQVAGKCGQHKTHQKRLPEDSKDGEVLGRRTEAGGKRIDHHHNGGGTYQEVPIVTSIQQTNPFLAADSDGRIVRIAACPI